LIALAFLIPNGRYIHMNLSFISMSF